MLALFTFRACGVCFMQRPPYFRFGKIVIFSKDSIDSEHGPSPEVLIQVLCLRVMVRVSLNAKINDPKYLWSIMLPV